MGFPIRTSPDHSSVDSSPRLIAASYVLLRLLVPRHPPSALSNLTTDISRCSRSLCSSQGTGEGTIQAVAAFHGPLRGCALASVPSGPNSVPGPAPAGDPFHATEVAVLGSRTGSRPNSQCFHIYEQPLRTFVSPALWTGCFHLARCSLERR